MTQVAWQECRNASFFEGLYLCLCLGGKLLKCLDFEAAVFALKGQATLISHWKKLLTRKSGLSTDPLVLSYSTLPTVYRVYQFGTPPPIIKKVTGFRDVQGLLSSRTSGKLKTITGPIIMVYHVIMKSPRFLWCIIKVKQKPNLGQRVFNPNRSRLYSSKYVFIACAAFVADVLTDDGVDSLDHAPRSIFHTIQLWVSSASFLMGNQEPGDVWNELKAALFFLVVRRYRIQTVGTILDMGLPTYIGNWFTFI